VIFIKYKKFILDRSIHSKEALTFMNKAKDMKVFVLQEKITSILTQFLQLLEKFHIEKIISNPI